MQPKNEIHFRLFKSAVNAVTDLINAGHFITYAALVNDEQFDPELINIGIDLKIAKFLITIAEDFRKNNQELINMYGIQKAVILKTIGYSPLHPEKLGIPPQNISNIAPEDLMRYLIAVKPADGLVIPYIGNISRQISPNELNLN